MADERPGTRDQRLRDQGTKGPRDQRPETRPEGRTQNPCRAKRHADRFSPAQHGRRRNLSLNKPKTQNSKPGCAPNSTPRLRTRDGPRALTRSEEHTSELQSLAYLVCRLLLEKKKSTLLADAPAARAYLLRRADAEPDRLVYLCESLGPAMPLSLASDQPPASLFLPSPFASIL